MTDLHSEFLCELKTRGFISDCTDYDTLDKLLCKNDSPVPAYIGFDCTAPSLHVGSMIQIMTLRAFQKSGNKPIVLIGGGTTKIGDPSGKDESRKMLTEEGILANKESIRKVFGKFLEFEDKFDKTSNKAFMVDNADWLNNINYIDFLREYGPHFSINRMLSMESVKLRLDREHHLSFLEFNYMILQAYDFVKLNREFGCRLQIGGSDQWGNIVNGIELSRRLSGDELFGLTTPLITTASGGKMGKTAQGAVWLNEDMLSPYDYWQFWRNTDDGDVGRFLRFFTDLPLEKIYELESLEGADINKAKIILANETTTLCHGAAAAESAQKTAGKTFECGGVGDDLPVFEIEKHILEAGISAYALFNSAGLEKSGGAAKRLIKGGGAKINGVTVKDENLIVTMENINDSDIIKLSAGKKRHTIIRVK